MESKKNKRYIKKRNESIRRILDAAMEVFAEAGYEGARVDEIAKRAGVNKAMVYYRVGDKKTLYIEVLHDIFGNIADRILNNIRDDSGPEEKFKTYIANLAATMVRHPSLPRIMMREVASGWSHFNAVVVKDIAGILVIVKDIVDDGVGKGVFIDINPVIVHMMVIGTMLLFNLSLPVREEFHHLLKGRIEVPDDFLEDIVPEIQKIFLRTLRVQS